ncbi:uncharacterized protein CLUP02_00174 [Colletotrichum lupini]|uniref:Uncharacterized protein n=1 Tax=Colletotrichum lupini TaxID=145971 RepID=A0A9Q8SA58_9PEZI|nr:uncharacterized protein CLUP02_00174 [Colletotrichum lupini]UQC73529.1 hypothetical protein CLUP02_00174 [Colletotrichum lupini]
MLPRSLPSPLLCFPLSLSFDPPTRFRFRFRFPIACPPPIDWHCQTAIEHLEFFVRISEHQATTESPDTHNLTSPPLFLVPPSTLDLQSGPESSGPPPASPVNSLRRIRERKNKAPQNQTSVIRLRPSRLFSLWVSPFCLPADTTPPSPSVHRLLPTVVRPDILPAQHHAADCRQLLSHSRYLTPSPKRHDQSLAPAASSTAPVAARRPLTSSPALDSGTWPPFPAPSAPKESQARPDFDELSISP